MPHRSLCGSKVVSHVETNYVFVALWDDHTPYSMLRFFAVPTLVHSVDTHVVQQALREGGRA